MLALPLCGNIQEGDLNVNDSPYDVVLFDLDGTLTCSEDGIIGSAEYALEKLGMEKPAGLDLRCIIGPPLFYSFRNTFGLDEARAWEGIGYYRAFHDREGYKRYTVYPHIRELLTLLRQDGVYLAVVTSKLREPTELVLKHLGLTHYFDQIVAPSSDEEPPEKAELVRRALPDRYRHAAMVGDRRFDIEGALANGIDAIGAGYGFGQEDELQTAGATHLAPDPESLLALLCPGMQAPRGFFLSMEGLDGSGKTTQADLLEQSLKDYGFSVLRTREPGGCEISEQVRRIVLGTENMEMCPACEALLYAAARAQHVEQVIRPALERGMVVLCDRFVDSSIAYQGGGRELGVETVSQLNEPAVGATLPDATVYLAIDCGEALARRSSASALDRLEMEALGFHERVQKAYERLIHENRRRFLVVDADRPIDDVARDVLQAVLGRIEPETQENRP